MTTLNTTDDLLRAARENQEFREAFRDEILADYTDENLDALAKSVATLTDNLAALTEQVTAFANATNSRLDRVDSRFDDVDSQLDRVDSRFDHVDSQFDRVDSRFDRVDFQSNRVDNDMAMLKGIGLESKLYNRGVALMSTHLRMNEGRIIRVAEQDDNSSEFNSTILSALKADLITQDQYDRILDTDMVVAGAETESGNPIYAVIEASYSLSGADISKVCATAVLVDRLFPGVVVKPVLYYLTPNERLEGEAIDQGVTLVRARDVR